MLHSRFDLFVGCLFTLGALAGCGMTASAGDKKKKIQPLLAIKETLTKNDAKDTHRLLKRSPCKAFRVKLDAGKVYQIDLASKDFDAVLRLEDSAGKEVAFNDDAPGQKTRDARLFFKATTTAEFKVIATCLRPGVGRFSLTVMEVPSLALATLFKSKAIDLKWTNDKARYQGRLVEQDGMVFDLYYKAFNITLEAGKTYRFDHQSAEFDAFLVLEDPSGNRIAENDDHGSGANSRIIHGAAQAGNYRVIATTTAARRTGRFLLEVTVVAAEKKR